MVQLGGPRGAGSFHVGKSGLQHRARSERVGSRVSPVEAHSPYRAVYTELPRGSVQSVQSPELRQSGCKFLVGSLRAHHIHLEYGPNRDGWHAQNRVHDAAGILIGYSFYKQIYPLIYNVRRTATCVLLPTGARYVTQPSRISSWRRSSCRRSDVYSTPCVRSK